MGTGHFICDAFSVVRWGDRRGFGTAELNRSQSPQERKEQCFDSAEGVAAPVDLRFGSAQDS